MFVDDGCGAKQPFNPDDPISSGLQQVLFPFPGFVAKRNTSDLKFTPLVTTGEKTGTVRYPRHDADVALRQRARPEPQSAADSHRRVLRPGRPHPGQGEAAPADRRAVQERGSEKKAEKKPIASRRSTSW